MIIFFLFRGTNKLLYILIKKNPTSLQWISIAFAFLIEPNAMQLYGTTSALEYSNCMTQNLSAMPSNAKACAESCQLDEAVITSCLSKRGRELLSTSLAAADEYGACWSPSVYVDGSLYCLYDSIPCPSKTTDDFIDYVFIRSIFDSIRCCFAFSLFYNK